METLSMPTLQNGEQPGDHSRKLVADISPTKSCLCHDTGVSECVNCLTHDDLEDHTKNPEMEIFQLVDNTQNMEETKTQNVNETPNMDKTPNGNDFIKLKVPDGGYGWFIVLGCFIMHVIMGGLDRSEGVFFLLLQDTFSHSAQFTAWPGAIVCTLQLLLGPLANALCSKYSVRTVVIIGGVLMSLGLVLNCSAMNLYFFVFSHAIVGGVGRGLVYAPALIIVNMYFDKWVGLAAGLGTSGVGIGTFLIVPLTQYLSEYHGFTTTYLIMGGFSLNMLVAAMLFRPLSMHYKLTRSRACETKIIDETVTLRSGERTLSNVQIHNGNHGNHVNCFVKHDEVSTDETWSPDKVDRSTRTQCPNVKIRPDKKCSDRLPACIVSSFKLCFPVEKYAKKSRTKLFHLYLLKEPPFLMFCISIWLFAMAFRAAFTFMPALVKSRGIPESEAAMALSTAGVVDTIGRIVAGLLLDTSLLRPHRLVLYNMVIFGVAGVAFILPSLTTIAPFCILCGMYGLFTGAFISQKSVVLLDLLGQEHMASSFGLLIGFQGIGSLLGPPLAGALKDRFGTYDEAFYLGGGLLVVSGLLMVASNVLRVSRRKKQMKEEEIQV